MANTKTVISFKKETPMWAKWMFRITFALTTALTAYIAATNLLPETVKYEVTLILKLLIDPLIYAISKGFGVDRKNEDTTEQ